MPQFSESELLALDAEHRRNLLNLVSGMKSAHLVGTYDEEGVANLAVFNSVVHIGANPPLLGMVQRPLTVERQTYANLKNHGVYTLNAITTDIVQQAHQCSAKYPKGTSEFDKSGLKVATVDGFNAPFVQESPIKMGLKLVEELPIQSNGCILLIGQIVYLSIDTMLEPTDGYFRADELGLCSIAGLDSYYEQKRIARLPFARP